MLLGFEAVEEEYKRVSRARALAHLHRVDAHDVIEKPDGLGRFHATSRRPRPPSLPVCAALAPCLGLRDTHRTGRPPTCRFYPRSLTARLEAAEPINQYIYKLSPTFPHVELNKKGRAVQWPVGRVPTDSTSPRPLRALRPARHRVDPGCARLEASEPARALLPPNRCSSRRSRIPMRSWPRPS